MIKPPLEREIQKAILAFLKQQGVFAWRNNTGVIPVQRGNKVNYIHNGIKGSADIIGIWNRKFLAIEVKRPGLEASPDQKWFLNEVTRRGGIAFVAHGLEDIVLHMFSD